jgi:hypothetical protein
MRPKLVSFRVEAFSSDNRTESGTEAWEIKLDNTIEIGIAVPTAPGGAIQAMVKISLKAQAHKVQAPDVTASFNGEYAGRFVYPEGVQEAEVSGLASDDDHQYLLASQVFPLAMSHFRRELQSTGFDARNLPLGL